MAHRPWIIGGGFNVTRFLGERYLREGDLEAMEEFDSFIINCNLIEIKLNNRHFTWSNNREISSMALLDRFFVSDEIEDKFPSCKVVGFPYIFSNHCPIVLFRSNTNFGNKIFRLGKMWLLENNFKDLVANKWFSMNNYNSKFSDNIAKVWVRKLRDL